MELYTTFKEKVKKKVHVYMPRRAGFRQRLWLFLPNRFLQRKPIIFKLSLITVPGTIDELNEAESGGLSKCRV